MSIAVFFNGSSIVQLPADTSAFTKAGSVAVDQTGAVPPAVTDVLIQSNAAVGQQGQGVQQACVGGTLVPVNDQFTGSDGTPIYDRSPDVGPNWQRFDDTISGSRPGTQYIEWIQNHPGLGNDYRYSGMMLRAPRGYNVDPGGTDSGRAIVIFVASISTGELQLLAARVAWNGTGNVHEIEDAKSLGVVINDSNAGSAKLRVWIIGDTYYISHPNDGGAPITFTDSLTDGEQTWMVWTDEGGDTIQSIDDVIVTSALDTDVISLSNVADAEPLHNATIQQAAMGGTNEPLVDTFTAPDHRSITERPPDSGVNWQRQVDTPGTRELDATTEFVVNHPGITASWSGMIFRAPRAYGVDPQGADSGRSIRFEFRSDGGDLIMHVERIGWSAGVVPEFEHVPETVVNDGAGGPANVKVIATGNDWIVDHDNGAIAFTDANTDGQQNWLVFDNSGVNALPSIDNVRSTPFLDATGTADIETESGGAPTVYQNITGTADIETESGGAPTVYQTITGTVDIETESAGNPSPVGPVIDASGTADIETESGGAPTVYQNIIGTADIETESAGNPSPVGPIIDASGTADIETESSGAPTIYQVVTGTADIETESAGDPVVYQTITGTTDIETESGGRPQPEGIVDATGKADIETESGGVPTIIVTPTGTADIETESGGEPQFPLGPIDVTGTADIETQSGGNPLGSTLVYVYPRTLVVPRRQRQTVPRYAGPGYSRDRFIKPENAELLYTVRWDLSQLLLVNDSVAETIVSSVWVEQVGLTVSDPENLTTRTRIKVLAGTLGQTYTLMNEIVTSLGEKHQWTFEIEIADYESVGSFWKDPDSELTYRLNYSDRYLQDSDVISAALITPPGGLIEISQDYDQENAWIKLGGGTVPDSYRTRSRITLSTGEIDEHVFDLAMAET